MKDAELRTEHQMRLQEEINSNDVRLERARAKHRIKLQEEEINMKDVELKRERAEHCRSMQEKEMLIWTLRGALEVVWNSHNAFV